MSKRAWQVLRWDQPENDNDVVLLPNRVSLKDIYLAVSDLYGELKALDMLKDSQFVATKDYMAFEQVNTLQPVIEFKRMGQA